MIKAGLAVKDISPQPDAQYMMCGYPEPRNRVFTGIHDPLYASALYLDDGTTELLLIALDLAYYSKRRTAVARKLIEEACGIPERNIMITASHTHSGPPTDGDDYEPDPYCSEVYPEYVNFLERSFVELAVAAKADKFEAEIGIGKTICGKEKNIGGNRNDPDWVCDPEVWLIAVRDSSGKLRGMMLEYSLHPTIIHAETTLLTADYPGYIREYITNKYEDIVFGFLQGTSGNQSSRFFRDGQNFAEAKRYGYTLGEAADELIAKLDFSSDYKLAAYSESLSPPLQFLPALKEAKKISDTEKAKHEEMIANNEAYALVRSQECRLIGANIKYELAKAVAIGGDQLLTINDPFEIQIFAIGDTRLVGLQGEVFVEFGLQIKEASPYEKTFVVTIANGMTIGYLCTAKAYNEGNYEAIESMFAPEAGELVIAKAIAMLKET